MNRARPMATQLIKRKENIYIKHKHNRLRDSRLYLVLPSDYLRLVADKTTKKKKPWADYEPHSAHGHAVNYKTAGTIAWVELGVIQEDTQSQ